MHKYAIVLLNLGGPDALDAVRPFLYQLFSDRDIFKLPVGQKIFAKLMSALRAPKVREKYRHIGGKSPVNEWSEWQRSMLELELQKVVSAVKVYKAMRYWHPSIEDTAQKISQDVFDRIALLPLYPHYSETTTGSSINEWQRVYRGDKEKVAYIYDYFDNPKYIAALNERIDEAMMRFPENGRDDVQIVFSAHGTPERLKKKGDPYSKQIEETVASVMNARNFSNEYHLCFQSKVGPGKWLEPSTEEMIKALGARRKRHLLIVPVSFVSDHIETLFELDVEYRRTADSVNIENYVVMQGLNDSKTFVAALKELALKALLISEN
jgi:protoporphyrin/coproporphyrin ferrochelatase